ncbi:MAG TPA: ComEC/Rec2 family competence protein, partial [Acidobacteriota bacterium]|nr:ComEC/Rec2 family competence protein [Acidobacteriota bacterium]
APERPSGLVDLERTAQVEGQIASRPQLRRGRLGMTVRPLEVVQGGRRLNYPHLIQVSLPWKSDAQVAGKAAASAVLSTARTSLREVGWRRLPRPGEHVRFTAFLRQPTYFATPGAPDFRRILYLKGILHQVYLKSARQLELLPAVKEPPYLRPWRAVQEWVLGYQDQRTPQLDPRSWKILAGVCLGLRPDWSDAEWMRLQRLGLVHLFVVSGLHVSLLLALLHRLLGRWGRPGAMLTLSLLWTYVLVSGAGVPALRAAVMGTLFYLLWTEGLQRQPLNALGLAGLVVLVNQPETLFRSGFQFSFLSLAAIGLFYLPRARLIDQACLGCGDVNEKRLRLHRDPSQRLRRWLRFALEERLAFADPRLIRRPLRWLTAVLRWAVPLAAISFFIQITTLPLALGQSNRWLWTQVPSNLLLTPVISLMLPLGLLDLLLSRIPGLGDLSLWTVQTWGVFCHQLMAWAEPWTVGSFLPHPRRWEMAAYFILLASLHLLLMGRPRWLGYLAVPLLFYAWLSLGGMSIDAYFGRAAQALPAEAASSGRSQSSRPGPEASSPILRPLASGSFRESAKRGRGDTASIRKTECRSWLHVTLLDVGQGEAIHIAYPGGQSALVDTGGSWRNPGPLDFIGWRVTARYLWDVRSPPLRYLMLSHGDSDHAGAFVVVEKLFQPESVLLSWPQSRSPGWQDDDQMPDQERGRPTPGFPEDAGQRDSPGDLRANRRSPRFVRLQAGDAFDVGGVRHLILHPPRRGLGSDDNNNSLVMLILHGGCSILLTGDIESPAERRLLQDIPPVTVLKVAHHGAADSTTARFLDRVRPRLALISAGRTSPFKHPASATLERLEARNIPWFATASSGTLRWTSNGLRWTLSAYSAQSRRFSRVASGECRR